MTNPNSIALKPYNALFAQLYTERGSILLSAEQLGWIADNAAACRIAASQLRRLQDERELTQRDHEPPTKRDGSASTWPPPSERVDEIRGRE